ncbi:hypothetical protein JCM10207_009179 [Rhodosporidiobolus poonsookiae]
MTSTAKLIDSKVDASYTIVITCDFDADLSDKTLREKFPVKNVPLAGDWSLELKGTGDGVLIELEHKAMPLGRLGFGVECEYTLYWSDSGVLKPVDSGVWRSAPQPEGNDKGTSYGGFTCLEGGNGVFNEAEKLGNFDSKGCRRYRFVFQLQQQCLKLRHLSHSAETLAEGLGDAPFKPTPHNFRLAFPSLAKGGEACLWINAELLSHTCPYFKDLLDSDFAEAAPRRSKRARKSGAQLVDDADVSSDKKDFEDSDDEADDFRFAKVPPKHEEPPDDLSFREIKITQTAFTTYHALLTFLQTGHLRFVPLKSACKPSNPAGIATRSELVKLQLDEDPSLPLPVSPKSLYRLTDLLRIPDSTGLAALCLDTLSDSLTCHGAAYELFSDAAIHLDPIRKVVLAYVVANWAEVSATPSWKAYAARMKAGQLP